MTKYNLEKILKVIDQLEEKEGNNYEVYRVASLDDKRKDARSIEKVKEFYEEIEYNRAQADGYIYALFELKEILKGDNGRLRQKLNEELPVV